MVHFKLVSVGYSCFCATQDDICLAYEYGNLCNEKSYVHVIAAGAAVLVALFERSSLREVYVFLTLC